MKKQIRPVFTICVVVCSILVVLAFTLGIIHAVTGDHSVSIYADISECEAIKEHARTNGTFHPYELPASDRHINGLDYTAFFGGEYKDSSCSFKIYAYVFADEETAATYFKRHTGKDTGLKSNYSGGVGLFRAELVVVNENMAYVVYMPSRCKQEVYKLLAEVFSITICEG